MVPTGDTHRRGGCATLHAMAVLRVLAWLLVIALVAGALWVVLAGRGPVSLGGDRIPRAAYDAYREASALASSTADRCAVDWSVLAGIGRVESDHGRVDGPRRLLLDSTVVPPIRGPLLDGTDGRAAIPDTDGGVLDGNAAWDRAMGPLQFIPATWAELGRDGNGDGRADPDNLRDAALTAAAHLCLREPGDYSNRDELRRALVAYNPSGRYADDVIAWSDRYAATAADDLLETAAPRATGTAPAQASLISTVSIRSPGSRSPGSRSRIERTTSIPSVTRPKTL